MSGLLRPTLLALALLVFTTLSAEGAPKMGARAAHPARHAPERIWRLLLRPAPDELALAQISFRQAGRRRLSERSLHISVSGPFGDDYLVLASVAPSATPGVARALVLLVNRPSPLLDPASVDLRLAVHRTLGEETTSELANPFSRSASAPQPTLCDLAHGHALSGAQLSTLDSRGTPLSGFDAASAVAQAYDAACSLPYASAFKQTIQSSGSGGVPPAPTPAPGGEPPSPTPGPPHCISCDPRPGYACPLGVSSNVCVASVRRRATPTAASAH